MVSKLTDVLGILNTEFLNSFHCFVLQPPPLALSVCFYSHSPVIMSLWLCIVFIVYSFVWSVLSGNCSKVDQIWSITPCLYSWVFYLYHTGTHGHGGAIHYRLLLVCSLISFWGIRLTYNFWRRGGYGNLISHEEDYRWPILRRMIGSPLLFLLFNLSFIATYQNILLYLIALPVYDVMQGPSAIAVADIAVALAFSALLLMETVADQQHWAFHLKKAASDEKMKGSDPDVRDGFLQSGLFKYCRHPNYFAEQAIWVCVYLFSVTHVGSIEEAMSSILSLGAVLLILLFQGSMAFSESITRSKYPKYSDYAKRTSQCVPFFYGPRNLKLE